MYAIHFTGIGAAFLAATALTTAGVHWTVNKYNLLSPFGRKVALLVASFGLIGTGALYFDLARLAVRKVWS